MSHSFLTVPMMFKALSGKQSLSCSDITSLTTATKQNHSQSKRRRSSLVRSADTLLHRFVRPKSPLVHSMERTKTRTPASTPDLDDIDQRLLQIRKKLSMFREQDMEFRERLDSLSNSIDELASRSSLASDSLEDSDDDIDECRYKDDDQTIGNDLKNVSMSFSSEVLNCIPYITVTPYKRMWQSSDPSIHASEATNLSDKTSMIHQQLPQHAYSSDLLYL